MSAPAAAGLLRVLRAALDVALAAGALPVMELATRATGPRPLVTALRKLGRLAPGRDPRERAWLQRVLAALDARLPGGARCYRRVLCEIALDRDAAAEPLMLGLDRGGAPRSGHAWLGDRRGRTNPYDVELVL